jgi:ribosome-associated translation inhibitor RaiA
MYVPEQLLAQQQNCRNDSRRDEMTASPFRHDQNTNEDDARRAPLPAWVPRPVKRASGRTETLRTPAHVRVIGVELDEENRVLIRRKLGMKLGKFVASIERVTVRVTDVNGPRGGIDHACNVKVVLSGLPSVVVERRDVAPQAAIDLALRATEQAVRRSIGRRRIKARRRRTSDAWMSQSERLSDANARA